MNLETYAGLLAVVILAACVAAPIVMRGRRKPADPDWDCHARNRAWGDYPHGDAR